MGPLMGPLTSTTRGTSADTIGGRSLNGLKGGSDLHDLSEQTESPHTPIAHVATIDGSDQQEAFPPKSRLAADRALASRTFRGHGWLPLRLYFTSRKGLCKIRLPNRGALMGGAQHRCERINPPNRSEFHAVGWIDNFPVDHGAIGCFLATWREQIDF